MLIGNVGKEPDIRYYDHDQAVAQFPLATKVPDHTDWHTIMVWRGLAKIVEKYVHKGDKLYIEGRIRYRTYDDQKGQRRYVTEILAENIELLTPKSEGNDNVATPQSAQSQTQKTSQCETTVAEEDDALPF